MRADNTAALAAATLARAEQARTRARDTIRRLDHDGAAVTFAAVADLAGVSRSLLYRDPQLRDEIEQLRHPAPTPTRPPAAERATNDSLHQRLASALDDNRTLRNENLALRDQLAVVLGERRATAVTDRPRAPIIGSCS